MKNKLTFILFCTTIFSLSLTGIISLSNKTSTQVNAIDKPTDINLNDTTEASIRNYYSYLETLPESERRGTNLLKNLKYILVNNPSNTSKPARYFSYSQVRDIYRITDRQWTASPASEISGYDSSTNTITGFSGYSDNPYLYFYYRSDNFTNPHAANATISSTEGKSQTLLNQEHLWSVSHGFKGSTSTPSENAGTDLHHLVAADVAGNKWGHSNYTYGYVDVEDSGWVTTRTNWDNGANAILGNKRGTPKTTHSEDESSVVYEPQDSDKGDVARALFYMAARYNHYDGTSSSATQSEPDLEIIDYVGDENTTITCNGSNGTGKYGILTDLLDWHKNDPVTSETNTGYYEVHRNNLIYENYQYTRNPFIDFPEWIDYVWGSKKDTGVATPSTDTLYGYNSEIKPTAITLSESSLSLSPGETKQISVSSVTPSDASKSVNWSSNNTSVATVSSSGLIQAVGTGSAVVTATSTVDSNVKATLSVSVSGVSVTGVSLNKSTSSLDVGATETLIATISPSDASNKNVTWSSSNSDIATVTSEGVVTGCGNGSATITVKTVDGNYIASCIYTVTATVDEYYERITSTSSLTSGKYLVVCESASIAMNGGLASAALTASNNNISVNISNNIIVSSNEIDAAIFTYDSATSSLKSSSGLYIGASSNSDTSLVCNEVTPYTLDFDFDENGNALITSSTYPSAKLNVYGDSNFKFYTSSQTSIQLYKYSKSGGSGEIIVQNYKRITSLDEVSSGSYVITSLKTAGEYYAMNNTFPESAGGVSSTLVSVINDRITLAEGSLYAVTLTVTGTDLTISNSTYYLGYSGSSTDLIGKDTSYTWAIALNSVEKSLGTFDITGDSRHLAYSHAGTVPYFKSYKNLTAAYHSLDLFKLVEETTTYTKTDFANEFMSSIVCDSSGETAPTFIEGYSWSTLKTKFEILTNSDRLALISATANESSTDIVEQAMYRYDFIVSKYGTSIYEDFISRKPSNSLINKPLFGVNNDNSTQIMLIAIVSISSIAMFAFIKLKHRKEDK